MKISNLYSVALVLGIGLGACDSGSDNGGGGGCSADADCKGDRICDRGACLDPNGGGGTGDDGGGTDGDGASDEGAEQGAEEGAEEGDNADGEEGGENTYFYGAPAGGCYMDEVVAQFTDSEGETCAPVCSPSGLCPPSLVSAEPFCYPNDNLCYLICDPNEEQPCPDGAVCEGASDGEGGLCLYI